MRRLRVAAEAYKLLIPVALCVILCFYFNLFILGSFILLFGLFILYFFRDPERVSDLDESFILSPADGKVIAVTPKEDQSFGCGRYQVVSIFMSPFDVHVNRSPVNGEILSLKYERGSFQAAYKDGVEKRNERNYIWLGNSEERFLVVQIAGVLARRILCYVREGEKVKRGQRIGMIVFGSRVDTYIPDGFEILVRRGNRVKAGLTPLAKRGG